MKKQSEARTVSQYKLFSVLCTLFCAVMLFLSGMRSCGIISMNILVLMQDILLIAAFVTAAVIMFRKKKAVSVLCMLIAGLFIIHIALEAPYLMNQKFRIKHLASHKSGSYSTCVTSDNSVLRQTSYYETQKFNSEYSQNWIFDIIGEGEVTFVWTYYEGNPPQITENYSDTYYFDSNGNWKIK